MAGQDEGDRVTAPSQLDVVVCGFDGSPAALEAAGQAATIAEPGARFVGVSSWDPGQAIHAGIHTGTMVEELREAAARALHAAASRQPGLEQILMRGPDVASLLAAAADAEADLLCVGSHGGSRLTGVITGSVATALAHYAPCPVLIGRAHEDAGGSGPVLVATDRSADAIEAARLAERIAERAGSELRTLQADEEEGNVADRISAAASEMGASLIVVGSRGRTGLRSLGSVSERVAHRAPCSVLVVRPKTYPERS